MITGNKNDIIAYLMNEGIESTWDLSPHVEKKHRSLTQNAYYWKLLELLAVNTHIAKAELHNINLRHLGLIERMDGKPIYLLLPDTDKTEKDVLLETKYHLAPTRKTKAGTDDKVYRWYIMLKGSKDMTVKEFSALTDLAIQDAKEQGIETLPPKELEHMRQMELEHERRMENNN